MMFSTQCVTLFSLKVKFNLANPNRMQCLNPSSVSLSLSSCYIVLAMDSVIIAQIFSSF
jgi:hypothetical protein